MKSGMQTYFFLASYAFRSNVLVLVIVKKISDPGSGKNSSRIPDPGGGLKAPGPGSGSATLGSIIVIQPLFVPALQNLNQLLMNIFCSEHEMCNKKVWAHFKIILAFGERSTVNDFTKK
jgi:hypothetical protein